MIVPHIYQCCTFKVNLPTSSLSSCSLVIISLVQTSSSWKALMVACLCALSAFPASMMKTMMKDEQEQEKQFLEAGKCVSMAHGWELQATIHIGYRSRGCSYIWWLSYIYGKIKFAGYGCRNGKTRVVAYTDVYVQVILTKGIFTIHRCSTGKSSRAASLYSWCSFTSGIWTHFLHPPHVPWDVGLHHLSSSLGAHSSDVASCSAGRRVCQW